MLKIYIYMQHYTTPQILMENQLVPVGFPFKQSHEGSHAKVLGVQMGGTKENCKENTNYHPKSKPTEMDGKN